ncbi:MAG: ParB N-terminal domain-containing protein [Oscillospiraceae bacterium]|nr:ParB N-terminal domain-containing protein [Oscillospiraceae bacterium]
MAITKNLKARRNRNTVGSMLSMDTADSLSKAISENEADGENNDSVKRVKISSLRTHEDNIYNKNDTEDAIKELAENIKKNGLMHNAVVTQRPDEGGYIILSGERRYKAYEYLYNQAKSVGDADKMREYSALPCKILTISVPDERLRRNAEQLYLDTANVFTREGIADHEIFEIVSTRYVNNLMLVYNMSEAEAKNTLRVGIQKQTGIDRRRTIDRNMRIYRELIPELYRFLHSDESDVSKKDTLMLTDFSVDEQKIILGVLKTLSSYKIRLGVTYGERYSAFQNKVYEISTEDERTRKDKLRAIALACEDDILAYVRAQNTTARSRDADLTAEMIMRRKYAKNIDNAYSQIKKLSSKRILKQIKSLENSKNDDISLVEKLNELERLIREVKSQL